VPPVLRCAVAEGRVRDSRTQARVDSRAIAEISLVLEPYLIGVTGGLLADSVPVPLTFVAVAAEREGIPVLLPSP
jgi:hypothetical protein